MRPANERRRYSVTTSLIGCAHTQNDPCPFHHDMQISWNDHSSPPITLSGSKLRWGPPALSYTNCMVRNLHTSANDQNHTGKNIKIIHNDVKAWRRFL